MALDDLIIAVAHSTLPTRTLLVSQLKLVKDTGKVCNDQLQTYTSHLSAAVQLIINSASFTLNILERGTISPRWYFWDTNTGEEGAKAFEHTLQIFEVFVHKLAHSNGQTYACLEDLESHIDVLKHLIGEQSELTSREIGHLLGMLWYYVGGNRSLLADANSRYKTLVNTGVQTKAIQRLVWDVQGDLKDLQTNSDVLRSYASEPLITHRTSRDAIQALSSGCQNLREKLRPEGRGRGILESSPTTSYAATYGWVI
ncbi:hypothetical protein B0H14DRAFT_3494239 [Mycena olivaceomarginata]|nr:hypothetical protein B0H14DRAFT_3494239 [Mycena olivaceomarginata]